MTAILEANRLRLYNEKSYTKTGLEFPKGDSWKEELKKHIQKNSYFIAYLDYAVIIGTYKDKIFTYYDRDKDSISHVFDSKFIQKLRVFNENSEFYMWRTENQLKARFRTEENLSDSKFKELDYQLSEQNEFVQANQILFGTTSEPITLRQAQGDKVVMVSLSNHQYDNSGFTKLTEDRGTEVILPFSNIFVDNADKRVAIRTRNYIGYNEIGQAGYVDCRFVEFVKVDKNNTYYIWDENKQDWVLERK